MGLLVCPIKTKGTAKNNRIQLACPSNLKILIILEKRGLVICKEMYFIEYEADFFYWNRKIKLNPPHFRIKTSPESNLKTRHLKIAITVKLHSLKSGIQEKRQDLSLKNSERKF